MQSRLSKTAEAGRGHVRPKDEFPFCACLTHNDLKQRACLSTFLRDKLAVLCEQILLNQINNALSLAQLFDYTVDDIRAIQRSIMEPHSYDKLYAPFKPYWAYWRELSEEAVDRVENVGVRGTP